MIEHNVLFTLENGSQCFTCHGPACDMASILMTIENMSNWPAIKREYFKEHPDPFLRSITLSDVPVCAKAA